MLVTLWCFLLSILVQQDLRISFLFFSSSGGVFLFFFFFFPLVYWLLLASLTCVKAEHLSVHRIGTEVDVSLSFRDSLWASLNFPLFIFAFFVNFDLHNFFFLKSFNSLILIFFLSSHFYCIEASLNFLTILLVSPVTKVACFSNCIQNFS